MNGLSSTDEYMVAKCTWASDCDGKEVINGRIDRYIIDDEWCEIVEEQGGNSLLRKQDIKEGIELTVTELIKMLEPYKDRNLGKKYIIDFEKGNLVIKQNKRKVKSKEQTMQEVVEKINNKNHTYNFKEFAYAFEHFCREFGYTYTTRLQVDQQAIKKIFPTHKSFGREELALVYTYIRIFEKQVKTATYLSPTWGGMVFAMPKIKQALRASEVRQQKIVDSQLADEVY